MPARRSRRPLMKKNNSSDTIEQAGRRLVQTGFLLLFLFPLGVVLYQKITYNPAPAFTSWLLPWDPALLAGQTFSADLAKIVIGAPLLLLALTFVFGRFFCGWVCPLGTLLDLLRPFFFWQRRKPLHEKPALFPRGRNRAARYYLLAFVLGASLFSLRWLGIFDPLVIFNRASAALAAGALSPVRPGIRAGLTLLSLVFAAILALELWQPRFWCRNLCPLGALFSLASRFSLLRRLVSAEKCTSCAGCQTACPMNAISDRGQSTDYSHCTFCLECERACPNQGIAFGFARNPGRTAPIPADISRRRFLGAAAAAAGGAALMPLAGLAPKHAVLRPPGALPEDEFIRRCILCQECVRACPTGGLKTALLESGLGGIGTPILVPRSGGCALNPSCPDLCASVCPVGAIQPVTKESMKIGVAVVHREACLAWDQGAKCLVCVEACLNEAAIPYNGRVTVDPSRCTGCGRCESGCPVPGSAIRVAPVAEAFLSAHEVREIITTGFKDIRMN